MYVGSWGYAGGWYRFGRANFNCVNATRQLLSQRLPPKGVLGSEGAKRRAQPWLEVLPSPSRGQDPLLATERVQLGRQQQRSPWALLPVLLSSRVVVGWGLRGRYLPGKVQQGAANPSLCNCPGKGRQGLLPSPASTPSPRELGWGGNGGTCACVNRHRGLKHHVPSAGFFQGTAEPRAGL